MSEKVGTTANGIPTPVTTMAGIDSHNFLLRTQDNYLYHYTKRQFKYQGQHGGREHPDRFYHVFIAHITNCVYHQLCPQHWW